MEKILLFILKTGSFAISKDSSPTIIVFENGRISLKFTLSRLTFSVSIFILRLYFSIDATQFKKYLTVRSHFG